MYQARLDPAAARELAHQRRRFHEVGSRADHQDRFQTFLPFSILPEYIFL
jgi:hypothetical protein